MILRFQTSFGFGVSLRPPVWVLITQFVGQHKTWCLHHKTLAPVWCQSDSFGFLGINLWPQFALSITRFGGWHKTQVSQHKMAQTSTKLWHQLTGASRILGSHINEALITTSISQMHLQISFCACLFLPLTAPLIQLVTFVPADWLFVWSVWTMRRSRNGGRCAFNLLSSERSSLNSIVLF